jgi:hypothetical protein
MTALPYLEDVERPEGETGMSEDPARAGASLPVSVERFSGTRLRVMVGNGVPECEGNLLLHFKRTINKTVKLFKGQGTTDSKPQYLLHAVYPIFLGDYPLCSD